MTPPPECSWCGGSPARLTDEDGHPVCEACLDAPVSHRSPERDRAMREALVTMMEGGHAPECDGHVTCPTCFGCGGACSCDHEAHEVGERGSCPAWESCHGCDGNLVVHCPATTHEGRAA